MRIHIGVSMGQGRLSQTAVIAVRHQLLAREEPTSERELTAIVGHIEQLTPTVTAASDRIISLVDGENTQPCVFVDTSSASGLALWETLRVEKQRGRYPTEVDAGPVHAPHRLPAGDPSAEAYRKAYLARIQKAFATGRIQFTDGLDRRPLDKAIALAVATGEVVDPLVIALGMSLLFPTHGTYPDLRQRDGTVVIHPDASTDPY